jgi:hypothetical protein
LFSGERIVKMALYLVSYDIAEKDRDEYTELWAALRNLKAVRILFSEWVVATASDGVAQRIYDHLAPYIRQADRLLVQEMAREAIWDKLMISDEKFRSLVVDNARF